MCAPASTKTMGLDALSLVAHACLGWHAFSVFPQTRGGVRSTYGEFGSLCGLRKRTAQWTCALKRRSPTCCRYAVQKCPTNHRLDLKPIPYSSFDQFKMLTISLNRCLYCDYVITLKPGCSMVTRPQ